MKVGDLVKLAGTETRKGHEWEERLGIILEIMCERGYTDGAVTVDFGGIIVKYAANRLRVVNES